MSSHARTKAGGVNNSHFQSSLTSSVNTFHTSSHYGGSGGFTLNNLNRVNSHMVSSHAKSSHAIRKRNPLPNTHKTSSHATSSHARSSHVTSSHARSSHATSSHARSTLATGTFGRNNSSFSKNGMNTFMDRTYQDRQREFQDIERAKSKGEKPWKPK